MPSFFSHLVLNPLGILLLRYPEAVNRKCSVKKDVFKHFAKFRGKQLCGVSFSTRLQADYCRKEIVAHVFSNKIFKILKNVFFKEHLHMTDSGYEVFQTFFTHIPETFGTFRERFIFAIISFFLLLVPGFCKP